MIHFINNIIVFIKSLFSSKKKSETTKKAVSESNKESKKETPLYKELEENKEYKQKKKSEKKEERQRKRKEENKYKRILYLTFFFCFLAYLTIPPFVTTLFGEEVVIKAVITKEKDFFYKVDYFFENDINNIYSITKNGDEISLQNLLWDTDVDKKIKIKYINRDKGFFITELPHEINLFTKCFTKYNELKRPKYVLLTLKVTSLKQIIMDVEIDKSRR